MENCLGSVIVNYEKTHIYVNRSLIGAATKVGRHKRFLRRMGPKRILQVVNYGTQVYRVLIIDNTELSPSKSVVGMTLNLYIEEVFRLARNIMLKFAMRDLPFGGVKSKIIADPKINRKRKDEGYRGLVKGVEASVTKSVYFGGRY